MPTAIIVNYSHRNPKVFYLRKYLLSEIQVEVLMYGEDRG